jgi:sporulation protein YqfC
MTNIFKQNVISAGESFADAFSLPKDVVAGATIFHMIGRCELYVENFKGIILYTCNNVIIKGNNVKYSITGEHLLIDYFSSEDMKISGEINEVILLK